MTARGWIALLGILVPAALATAGVWLVLFLQHDLAAAEKAAALRSLEEVKRSFRARLSPGEVESGPGFLLRLDRSGRPTAPFRVRRHLLSAPPRKEMATRLKLASELEGSDQVDAARQLLGAEPLAENPSVRARWRLARARLAMRCGDSADFEAALRPLERDGSYRDIGVDGVPVFVLARLLRARRDAAAGDPTVAEALRDDLTHGALQLPCGAAIPLLARCDAMIGSQDLPASERLAAALHWFDLLAKATLRPPTALNVSAEGVAVVPVSGGLFLLAPGDVAVRLNEAIRETAERAPALRLIPSGNDPGAALAVAGLAPFAMGVAALPDGSQPSDRVMRLGAVLIGVALALLIAGNLLARRAAHRAAEVARHREDFADLVSHELRTPLTALSMRTEMLARGEVPAERRDDYLRKVHGAVGDLGHLVERMLDFARLQPGRAPIPGEAVDLRGVIAAAVREMRPLLSLSGRRLALDVPRVVMPVRGEARLLERVLVNLVDNALKYDAGGGPVEIRCRADDEAVTLSVLDRGPGISDEDREHVFGAFARGRVARLRGVAGTGLGLAFVQRALLALGGAVDYRPREGGGSRFELRLPVAAEGGPR